MVLMVRNNIVGEALLGESKLNDVCYIPLLHFGSSTCSIQLIVAPLALN